MVLLLVTVAHAEKVEIHGKVIAVTDDIITLDLGQSQIAEGMTGVVYYEFVIGDETKTNTIGRFEVTDVGESESKARILSKTTAISPGRSVRITLDIQPGIGVLHVLSEPSGAQVTLDGEDIGQTELVKNRVASGIYTVRIALRFYCPVTRTVIVQPGATTKLNVSLERNWGNLVVTSEPPGADVQVGKQKGRTPHAFEHLTAGEYEVQVQLEGYYPWKRQVVVDNQESKVLEAQLEKHAVLVVEEAFRRHAPRKRPAGTTNPKLDLTRDHGYRKLSEMQQDSVDLIKKVSSSVVRIETEGDESSRIGSGILIDKEGYVLTSSQVIHAAETIQVTLADTREFSAKVIGSDVITDIAVVKIGGAQLSILPMGDSDKLEQGEHIVVVGGPLKSGQRNIHGTIQSTGQFTTIPKLSDLIRMNVPIDYRTVGGALITNHPELPELMGVCIVPDGTQGYTDGGFAIPLNLARKIATDLISTGEVQRPMDEASVWALLEPSKRIERNREEARRLPIRSVLDGLTKELDEHWFRIIASARPAVVRVEMTDSQGLHSGSGVIITDDGYIVTSSQIVHMAETIRVTLADRREFSADVIGSDVITDIALLKIKGRNLPCIQLGDSDMLDIGEWVVAISSGSSATSLSQQSMFYATIQSKGRSNTLIPRPSDLIQMDITIDGQLLGGALINHRGELIGINTTISDEIHTCTGDGFAIPVNLTKKIVRDLLEKGKIRKYD